MLWRKANISVPKAVGHPNRQFDLAIGSLHSGIGDLVRHDGDNRVHMTPDLPLELDEFRNSAGSGSAAPFFQRRTDFLCWEVKDCPETYLQAIGCGQPSVIKENLPKLGLSRLAQMLQVHQQWVLGILHDLGFFLRGGFLHGATLWTALLALALSFVLFSRLPPCFVPLLPSDGVKDFLTPGNHMERVEAERRLRTVIRNGILDPPGSIARYQLNAFTLRRCQFLEEAFKHLPAKSLGRPDHCVRIVVDDNGDVLATLLVGSLINPDFNQSVKSGLMRLPGRVRYVAKSSQDLE